MPILMLLMNICILFILWFGAKSIAQGGAQVGDVVSVINYATRITGALSVLPFLIMVFSRAKASGERIGEVLETEGGEGTGQDPARALAGGIEFREVSFRYPGMEKTRCIKCPFCQPERNGCHYGRDRLRKINAFSADSASVHG